MADPLPDGSVPEASVEEQAPRAISPPLPPVQHVTAVSKPIAPSRAGGPAATPTNGSHAATAPSAPAAPTTPTVLRAVVKSALSSSSVVLRGQPGPQGQPPRGASS